MACVKQVCGSPDEFDWSFSNNGNRGNGGGNGDGGGNGSGGARKPYWERDHAQEFHGSQSPRALHEGRVLYGDVDSSGRILPRLMEASESDLEFYDATFLDTFKETMDKHAIDISSGTRSKIRFAGRLEFKEPVGEAMVKGPSDDTKSNKQFTTWGVKSYNLIGVYDYVNGKWERVTLYPSKKAPNLRDPWASVL